MTNSSIARAPAKLGLRALNLGASSQVLAVAAGGDRRFDYAPPVNEAMGDAASKVALSRLDATAAQWKAMAVAPLLRKAVKALGEGDFQRAAELALKALEKDERCGLAWHVLAIAREKVGDFKTSLASYESALLLMPNDADIANNLGCLAFRLNMKSEAAQLFSLYRAERPECIQGANNLAQALRDLQEYDRAIETLRPAIEANPEAALLWDTLGTVLNEKGDLTSAMTFFDEALRLKPDLSTALYNRADTLLDLGDPQTALTECVKAIKNARGDSEIAMMEFARATMLISLGRLGEGWDAYEARLDPSYAEVTHFNVKLPRWTPDTNLAGRNLLVMGEQGLGDELAFAGVIPDALEALGPNGHMHLAVQPRLVTLFQRSFPTVEVTGHTTYQVDMRTVRAAPEIEDFDAFDFWTPMGSLLRGYRRNIDDFLGQRPFLTADPERVAYWRNVLAERPGPKVGVQWKTLKFSGKRLRFYAHFEHWRPVLQTPGVSFINLQYGDCDAELAEASEALGVEIWRPPGIDLMNDLDDVAALSCALDLVIGPVNTTTNIAAACGARVWLIMSPSLWTRMGTLNYPYYPWIKTFAPDRIGAWDDAFAKVAQALAAES